MAKLEQSRYNISSLRPYQEVQILGKFHIVREGYVFIFGALAVAAFLGIVLGPLGAVVPGILAVYFTYFFISTSPIVSITKIPFIINHNKNCQFKTNSFLLVLIYIQIRIQFNINYIIYHIINNIVE